VGTEGVSALLIYGKNAVLEYLRAAADMIDGTLFIARAPDCRQAEFARKCARELGLRCIGRSRRDLDKEYPGCSHQGFVLSIRGQGGTLDSPKAEQVRPGPREMEYTGGAASARQDASPRGDFDWEKELSAAIGRGEKPRVLILDQVQDPGNLGAIVRSAAQFDVACIFTPRDKASGFTAAARKSACGGENFVPVVQAVNLARLLDTLKAMGFWSAAASGSGGKTLDEFDFKLPYAIILGSEGKGVRRLLLEKADQRLCIPMTGRIDSLNVSVAAGIIMHAMYRERGTCTPPRP